MSEPQNREKLLDILDSVTGSRLTYSYGRFGGVSMDVDDTFLRATAEFCDYFRTRIDEYHSLVTNNIIFRHRTKNVGGMVCAPPVWRVICARMSLTVSMTVLNLTSSPRKVAIASHGTWCAWARWNKA